ncbi:AEC family transporter [Leucobacter ruminantium]|uniref:AEC family transporter n=1 Tax=Leucobacter ruminantium TaxID=1289170 RepID=A0A939LTE8_9MICO|nr:AEC family transporter [Leucobacter ruminantium]MBO1804026.1 AEC family transporter [Leucobacter ruminantium]
MLEVIPTIAPLFVLLGVGMAAGFSQRFRSAQAGLNAFVFTFSLPAFLFTALSKAPIAEGIPLPFVVVSFALPGAVALVVYAAALIRRRSSRGDSGPILAGPLAVAATYGNVGYLGVPIAMSIVGPGAALAAALGQLLHNVLFMVGYPLLKSIGSGAPAAGSALSRLLSVLWTVLKRSVLLNPVVLGVVAGVLAGALPVEIPEVIDASITMLGQAAVPAAMFAVGLSIKPAFEGMRSGSVPLGAVLLASAVKLLALPLLTILALLPLGGSLAPEWVATAVIMAAVPVSSTASIIVFEYDGDTRLTSATTLLTSVAAIVTVPLMIALTP